MVERSYTTDILCSHSTCSIEHTTTFKDKPRTEEEHDESNAILSDAARFEKCSSVVPACIAAYEQFATTR
jgi:hypothetical protein